MRLKREEQLGTFGQRDIHLYQQRETYFVLSEMRNNVVYSSKSRPGKATVGSWCTGKMWNIYRVEKATFYILSQERAIDM